MGPMLVIDRQLFGFARFRPTMLLLALLSALQGVAIVAQAYGLTLSLVAIWRQRPVSSLPVPVGIFVCAFAARQLCEVAKQRVSTGYADGVVTGLRPRVQRKLFSLGPISMARRGTGANVTMLIDGMDQTTTYIQTIMPKITDMTIVPVIVLAVVWSRSWLSGLVLLLVLPMLLFFMVILGLAARDKADRQYGEFRALNNRFVDTILGLPTLKMLGVDKAYEKEIHGVSERFRTRTMGVIRVAMASTFALDFFTTLSIAIVAVFLGTSLINGTISLFPSLLSLILAPEYFLPIRQFGSDYHVTLNGKNALNDIMTVLDTPEPARDDRLSWSGWGQSSSLSLSHVDFAYEPHESVSAPARDGMGHDSRSNDVAGAALRDVSLDLHGYETVAIVGRSGAGKSTLINLLAGFIIAQHGGIVLDGQRIDRLNSDAWQGHISYIPQQPYIFHGTIADNIRFYDRHADDSRVRSAASQAGLDGWLRSLPRGMDTPIGEGNRAISGGQAQRIALARAVLDESRTILLLDEPTAHLDIETEYDLKSTLLPVMRNRLVLLATHRLHWLDSVDRVVVLDRGSVVQAGAPCDLVGRGGALDALMEQMGANHIDGRLED
jgi:ATP-binding cassette subfamily C protein CydD